MMVGIRSDDRLCVLSGLELLPAALNSIDRLPRVGVEFPRPERYGPVDVWWADSDELVQDPANRPDPGGTVRLWGASLPISVGMRNVDDG